MLTSVQTFRYGGGLSLIYTYALQGAIVSQLGNYGCGIIGSKPFFVNEKRLWSKLAGSC